MIQFMGVVAVIGILVCALRPAVFKRMDQGAWTKEFNDMNALSNALVLQMLKSNSVPDQTTWAGSAANWVARPVSQISTNGRGYARLFFYDQGGWMTNAPYYQTNVGTAGIIPANARIVLVSTIAKALPYANGALSTSNFNSLWNAVRSATPGYLTSQGWTGNSYDLVIQRVSLDPFFHHLILANRDASTPAAFSINSTNSAGTVTVTNNPAGWNSYYLDGSVVGLWGANNLTNRFILTRDVSFTFESGTWTGQLTGAGTDNRGTAQSFANQALTFISTSAIPGQHQGADTQGVLSSFYSFMYSYTLWANRCPHFQFSGNPSQDADYVILNTLGQNGSGGIINGATGSAGGGLLQ